MLVQSAVKKNKGVPTLRVSPLQEEELDKKIFDTDIGQLSVAHSKARFAQLIEEGGEFTDGIEFDSFKPIFDRVRQILDQSKIDNQ